MNGIGRALNQSLWQRGKGGFSLRYALRPPAGDPIGETADVGKQSCPDMEFAPEFRNRVASSVSGSFFVGTIGQEGAQILRAFKGRGIRAVFLAHASLQLAHRLIIVLRQPVRHIVLDVSNNADALLE
jgi:hypothetical protein